MKHTMNQLPNPYYIFKSNRDAIYSVKKMKILEKSQSTVTFCITGKRTKVRMETNLQQENFQNNRDRRC
ncbi:hypothetical protein [Natronincola peptidivorans]|uniref:hypothetical protein n=1 Tax=Natronincola peptidivorans TaxID=426128 RepID=UPI000B83CAC5|nr:hypothetical protein [Natronincola peptidivorans]